MNPHGNHRRRWGPLRVACCRDTEPNRDCSRGSLNFTVVFVQCFPGLSGNAHGKGSRRARILLRAMQPQSWVTSDIYSGPSQPKCWRECRLQDLLSRRQWTAGRFWRVREAFPQVTIHHAPWPAASPWGPTADREVQLCTLLFLAMKHSSYQRCCD